MRDARPVTQLGPLRLRMDMGVVAFIAAVCLAAPTAIAQPKTEGAGEDGKKIILRVDVEGNKRVDAEVIRREMRSKPGDAFSAEELNKDVERLWRLRYFDDIRVTREDVEKGIRLVVKVVERPVVQRIRIKGNRRLRDSKLREEIEIKEKSSLQYYVLKLDEVKIRDAYLKDGYQFVEVRHETRTVEDGVEVTYRVNEGPKVRIAQVTFTGNTAFPPKKLLKEMTTRPKKFPSFIWPGIFKEADFEADVLKLKEFYRNEGWLDVALGWDFRYSDDRKRMFIEMKVQEGERYYVETLTIRGNRLYSTPEIREALPLTEGGPFSPQKFQDGGTKINDLYGEQGYINSRVRRRRAFSQTGARVHASYDVDEGERIYVDKIKIAGNEKTRDNVIRRELSFYPGERANTAKIRESVDALVGTGYFDLESDQPIKIDTEIGSAPDRRNILIDVIEGRTGTLSLGVGVSSNAGLMGDISYTDANFDITDTPKSLEDVLQGNAFHGAGQKLTIRFSPGTQRSEVSVAFQDPSYRDGPYSYGAQAFWYNRKYRKFEEGRTGAFVTLGKRLARHQVGKLTGGAELIMIDGVGDNVPKPMKDSEGNHVKLSLTPSLEWDTRNHRVFPTQGYKSDMALEAATVNVNTVKFIAQGKKYYPVANIAGWGKHVASLAGTFGAMESYSGDVPIFERFFAGGAAGGYAASLRGFRYRGISPVDSVYREQIGGNLLLLGTAEYVVPVYKNYVRAVAFFDTGAVQEDVFDFMKLGDFRASVGVGARIWLPFLGQGHISLDLAMPIKSKSEDDKQVFSFSLGREMRF